MQQGRCMACRHFRWRHAAERKPKDGRCTLDNQACHANYGCTRYEPSARAMTAQLGLTLEEIDWLKEHPKTVLAQALRQAFQAAWQAPQDSALRTAFAAQLDAWRGVPTPIGRAQETAAAVRRQSSRH